MATWETSDGKKFEGNDTYNSYANINAQSDAERHQAGLDNASSSSSSSSSGSSSSSRSITYSSPTNDIFKFYKAGDYDNAIAECNKFISRPYTNPSFSEDTLIGEAYTVRGDCYRQKGNSEQALADFKKAAEDYGYQGAVKILKSMGVQFTDSTMKKALSGDSYYMMCVAERYKKGESGYPQDHAESVKWYRKSAENGQMQAQYELGKMYYEGINVAKDEKEGIEWFRLAAEGGYANAEIYLDRIGVKYKVSSSSYDDDDSSSSSKKYNIIGAVAGGVILSLIINFPIGTIIGAVAGWFLGKFLANKFLLVVFIVGAIGAGLYFGRAHIEPLAAPLIASVTGKANPFAQTVMVTADALNLRAEASGSSDVVKALKKGDTLTVTGAAQDGWLPVASGSDKGFVSAQYVE